MIGHSVKRIHQIEKVATDTSFTNPDRITFTMPSDDDINPPPCREITILAGKGYLARWTLSR